MSLIFSVALAIMIVVIRWPEATYANRLSGPKLCVQLCESVGQCHLASQTYNEMVCVVTSACGDASRHSAKRWMYCSDSSVKQLGTYTSLEAETPAHPETTKSVLVLTSTLKPGAPLTPKPAAGDVTFFDNFVGAKPHTKGDPPGYLIFQTAKNKDLVYYATGKSIRKIKWEMKSQKTLCELCSATCDGNSVYWKCKGDRKMVVGAFIKRKIIFQKYLAFSATVDCHWISVDEQNGKLFSSSTDSDVKVLQFELKNNAMTSPRSLGPTYSKDRNFQVDKFRRRIYWMNKGLNVMNYTGERLATFPGIKVPYFFMDFGGDVPQVYGCSAGQILQYTASAPAAKTTLAKYDTSIPCFGIWRMGNITYFTSNKKGMFYIGKDKQLLQRWSLQIKPSDGLNVSSIDSPKRHS